MRVMRRRRLTLVVSGVLILALAVAARPYAHGLSFVVRAADMHGIPRRIADLDTGPEREGLIAVPTARGPLRARLYQPSRPARRIALLVSGLHPAGIEEPRLVALARQLAAGDLAIV